MSWNFDFFFRTLQPRRIEGNVRTTLERTARGRACFSCLGVLSKSIGCFAPPFSTLKCKSNTHNAYYLQKQATSLARNYLNA